MLLEELEKPLVVELEPASSQLVRVVDGSGARVAGAEVAQLALPRPLAEELSDVASLQGSGETPPGMLSVFRRTYTADDAGIVEIHPCGFPVAVQARSNEETSATGILHPRDEELVLRLLAPAQTLGKVHAPPGFTAFAALAIDAFQRPHDAIGTTELDLLGSSTVAPGGSWGPVILALEEGHGLVFRLRGGELMPLEIAVDPRVSEPPFVVDFRAELGEPLDVYVFRRDGEATVGIADALVDFRWRDEDSQRVLRVSGRTDAEGRAQIAGCKVTTGTVRATALGFAGARISPVALPRDMPLEIELLPGGTIAGSCRSAAGPVQDFDVLVWKDHASRHTVHVFRDRSDGSFLVEGAPFGPVQLMAVPAGLPESGVETVEVLASAVAHVELEVQRAVAGRGRVVDAETRAPVTGARIVPLVRSATQLIGERGQVFRVDAQGGFEFESFAPREAVIWVEAGGFARAQVFGSYVAGEGIDFGEIPLARASELVVRVISEEGFDASFLWFRSSGENPIAYVRMPPDGELRIEGVQPGHHKLHLVWPEGNMVTRWVELVPGRPWVEEFELSPGEEITVDVQAPEGVELLPDTAVFATYRNSQDAPMIRAWFVPPDGQVVLTDCTADEVWLEVVDPEGRLLGFTHAVFESGAPRHATVQLTDRSLIVTVLDAEGAPLPDSAVNLTTLDERQPYATHQAADGNGRCTFGGVDADVVLVTADHPIQGQRTLQVELLPQGPTEVELVLDGTADLHLRVVDDELALQGVKVQLSGAFRPIEMGSRLTNGEGVASFAQRSPGDFQAHIDHQGIWPVWHAFEFSGDATPVDIPVRRLGDVRIRVVDPQGLALAGISLELTSVELGETLSDWVAAHRVTAEPLALVTDSHGELRAKGLPHGSYLLDVTGPSRTTVRQQIVVPPVDTLQHLVALE